MAWEDNENNILGVLLRLGDASEWKRFCTTTPPRTLHDVIGHRLAFLYATERFYLFEHLTPQDFDPEEKESLGLQSLTDYLSEAKAIRDGHACFETIPDYRKDRTNFNRYFELYTTQLHLIQLAHEKDVERRKSLVDVIGQELSEEHRFGLPRRRLPFSLLRKMKIFGNATGFS